MDVRATIARDFSSLRTLRPSGVFAQTHGDRNFSCPPVFAAASCGDQLRAKFHTGFSEAAVQHVLRQTLDALKYLHEEEIIHRYGTPTFHVQMSLVFSRRRQDMYVFLT